MQYYGHRRTTSLFEVSQNLLCYRITRDADLIDVYELRKYEDFDVFSISVIKDCDFLKILQKFAMEACFTLSTLYRLDKIRDVRTQIGTQGKFYDTYVAYVSLL